MKHAPSEHFHEYLDYCENVELIGPSEYIEKLGRDATLLAWTRLVIDLKDTYEAGRLHKTHAENGSVAYTRKKEG